MTRVDVVELTDELSGRGDPLSLFVFSDSLEVRQLATLTKYHIGKVGKLHQYLLPKKSPPKNGIRIISLFNKEWH